MEKRRLRDDEGNEYTVDFQWDDEASVWIATSEDITGLVLESDSLDTLMRRVLLAAPELIELNHLPRREAVHFSVERREKMVFA